MGEIPKPNYPYPKVLFFNIFALVKLVMLTNMIIPRSYIYISVEQNLDKYEEILTSRKTVLMTFTSLCLSLVKGKNQFEGKFSA